MKFTESYQKAKNTFEQLKDHVESETAEQREKVRRAREHGLSLEDQRLAALEAGDMDLAENLTQQRRLNRDRLSLETDRLRILEKRLANRFPDELQMFVNEAARIQTEEAGPAIEKVRAKVSKAVAAAQRAIDELRQMVQARAGMYREVAQLMADSGLDYQEFPTAERGFNPSDFELKLGGPIQPNPQPHLKAAIPDFKKIYGDLSNVDLGETAPINAILGQTTVRPTPGF